MNEEIKVYDPGYKVIGKQKLELCDVTTYARDNDAGIQIIDIYSVDDKVVSISPAIYITEGMLVHDHDDMYKIVIPDEDDEFDDLAALYGADEIVPVHKHEADAPIYNCYDGNGDGIPDCKETGSLSYSISETLDKLVEKEQPSYEDNNTSISTIPSPNNIMDIPKSVKI